VLNIIVACIFLSVCIIYEREWEMKTKEEEEEEEEEEEVSLRLLPLLPHGHFDQQQMP